MPELPEVETARRRAEKYLTGKRIVSVYIARDPIVFQGANCRKFAGALGGRKILAVKRRGKHIWFELDKRPWPAFHFGMTGRFGFYRGQSARPKYCKVELGLTGGKRFAMTNVRRLGRIRLLDNPQHCPPINKLGFDPLLDKLDVEKIRRILSGRSAAIKAVLLDQSVFAGVGNWIADEVLYQAGLDPHRPACKLSTEAVGGICRCLGRIVRKAVAVDADSARYPASWLFHYRWDKNSQPTTTDGKRIEFDVIGGRTTAWVPHHQR